MTAFVAADREEAQTRGRLGNVRIVQLRSGSPGPSFFLVPGTGGRIEGFANLANLLQTQMPVFAIEARGIDGSSDPDDDLEEMVRHYLNRVRAVQPRGPYFLLGHSFGGLVVFEMAQRILEAGELVGCLILLDTLPPKRYWPLAFYLPQLRLRLHGHLVRLLTSAPRENLLYYCRRIILRRYGLHNIPPEIRFGQDAARMVLANELLLKKWHPRFYPGRLTFFYSAGSGDPALVWRRRVQELEAHAAEGDHLGLVLPPHVSSLAREISECLARGLCEGADATGRATRMKRPA